MSRRFAFSAAGFIATSTFGVSPGVTMSWSEMCTWNDETPAIVPAGARISAGKLGSVARSLPNAAESSVKRSPTSCMPSPESPANRITTRSSVSARRVGFASTVTVDLGFLVLLRSARPMHRRLASLLAPARTPPSARRAATVRARRVAFRLSRRVALTSSSTLERGRRAPHRGVDAPPVARSATTFGLDLDA